MNVNEELVKLAESERDLNERTLAAWLESIATLTGDIVSLAKANREQAAIIEDQRKQIAELSHFINTHYEPEESCSDLGKAIKAKIKADFPSMKKIKHNIEKQMKGA